MDRQVPRRWRMGHGPVRGRDGLDKLFRAETIDAFHDSPQLDTLLLFD